MKEPRGYDERGVADLDALQDDAELRYSEVLLGRADERIEELEAHAKKLWTERCDALREVERLQAENSNLLQELHEPESPEGRAYQSEVTRLEAEAEQWKTLYTEDPRHSGCRHNEQRLLQKLERLTAENSGGKAMSRERWVQEALLRLLDDQSLLGPYAALSVAYDFAGALFGEVE